MTGRIFEHNGLMCKTVKTRMGHWCGYVAVPKPHPLYEVIYWGLDFDVHGGLTYSEREGDKWWFGFDCNHDGDASSQETASPGEVYRDEDYVIRECKKLAQQLLDWGEKR